MIVTETDISPDRIQQGWKRPGFSPAQLVVAPSREERRSIVHANSHAQNIHIFTGLRGYKETYWTLKVASKAPSRIGIFLERPRDDEGLKSLLRRILYTADAQVWKKRLDFILAVGELGVRYYAKCGFPVGKIYPFGYFVEPQPEPTQGEREKVEPGQEHRDDVLFLYVGALVKLKALEVLLRAFAATQCRRWRLLIVGDGPEREFLRKEAFLLGINDRIQWLGVMDNRNARLLMEKADYLVLPSRYDGWGAVVNEALHAGARVIVSSACGARDLIESSGHGYVFGSGRTSQLAGILNRIVNDGPLSATIRAAIKKWANDRISPQSAASYLLDILKYMQGIGHAKPVSPWKKTWLDGES